MKSPKSGEFIESIINAQYLLEKMTEQPTSLRGYHYTTALNYRIMEDGSRYGRALVPRSRFLDMGEYWWVPEEDRDEASDGVIEALLEPFPAKWMSSSEFGGILDVLMDDICYAKDGSDILLLGFDLRTSDRAYVVDLAHHNRSLGHKRGSEEFKEHIRRYWASRIPVFDYDGRHEVPMLVIWEPIDYERLSVEWEKSIGEAWQHFKTSKQKFLQSINP